MRSSFRFLGVLATLSAVSSLSAIGCAPEESIEPDVATDGEDLVGRVSGAGLGSPNAKASATYLTGRRIDTLTQIGALSGVAADLAARVDGIIANQPADGRFSVKELLQIEKPGFVETLFPEEKAALPRLWEMLETVNGTAPNVALPATTGLEVVDVSTAAGAPVKPASLDIATLPTELVAPAKRLELTRNSDANATTVTEADLDGAIAQPGPYTPEEVAAFRKIKDIFLERAGTALHARAKVTDPGTVAKQLASWGPAKLMFSQSVTYDEYRSRTFFDRNRSSASLDVRLDAKLTRAVVAELPANHQLVVIDEASEHEIVSTGGALEKAEAGNSTVEVWSGGTRLRRFRAKLPAFASANEQRSLEAYVDYQLVGKTSGQPLVKNEVDAKNSYATYQETAYASYRWEAAAAPRPASFDPSAASATMTPGPVLLPGRYEIPVPSFGNLILDVYPEGVLRVTRPDGQSMRSRLYIWQNTQFDFTFNDRFRAIWDPQRQELNVFWDGRSSLFRGAVLGSMRKG